VERKREAFIFQAAAELGPYDEYPVLAPGIDPQLHVSRNDRDQPFFLICDHDVVLVQMSGRARVRMMDSPVMWEDLEPGDFFYVPARTPHRIEIIEPSVHVRYKAAAPEVEGVAWFCESCGSEVRRMEFDLTTELPQEGYARACDEFNASEDRRRCPTCATVHEPADLTGIRWTDAAKLVHAADEPAKE
jgi:mannose-6-phosphate isomerase-like protein (cupin superfamily)